MSNEITNFVTLLSDAVKNRNSQVLTDILKKHKGLLDQRSTVNDTEESLLDIMLHKIIDDNWSDGLEIFLSNINKKADIINKLSTTSSHQKTALHLAICKNNFKIINILIKYGASLEITDNINKNAFHYAARIGDLFIFQELERKIPDRQKMINLLNSRMDFNLNVIDYVVRNNHNNLFNYLTSKYKNELNFVGKDPKGNNNLHYAADNCNPDIFIKLLTFGVDINDRNNDGVDKISGYEAAISRYCSDIIKQVDLYHWQHKQKPVYLEIPFLIRAMTKFNDTCAQEHINFIQTLLKTGVNVHQANADKVYPLHYAAQSGNVELIKIYISRKADVEIKDSKGNTPLLYTAAYGRQEAFFYLIKECNANIYVKNNNGVGLAMRAAGVNNVAILEFILAIDPKLIFYQDKNFATPYHYAAGQNAAQAIVFLANNTKLGINLKDHQGNTAITVAAINHASQAFAALKEFNAEINLSNNYGYHGEKKFLTKQHSYYNILHNFWQYSTYIYKYTNTHAFLFLRLLLDIDKKSYDSTIKLSFQQYSPKMYDNFLADNAAATKKLTESFYLMHHAYNLNEDCKIINQYCAEQILTYSTVNVYACLNKKSLQTMEYIVEIFRMPILFFYGNYVNNFVQKNLPASQSFLKDFCPPMLLFVIHSAIINSQSLLNKLWDSELPVFSSIQHLYLHSTIYTNQQCNNHPIIYNISNGEEGNLVICEEKSMFDIFVDGI